MGNNRSFRRMGMGFWALVGMALILSLPAEAQQTPQGATPEEIIGKVEAAVEFLAEKGEAGLAEITAGGDPWVWKDSYVFVYHCGKGTISAHPIKPNLVGKQLIGLKDIKGNFFFAQLCEAARDPKGGWVAYWWPKPGEKEPSRKISLMHPVPGTPYQVGAGVYDEKITIETLDALLK